MASRKEGGGKRREERLLRVHSYILSVRRGRALGGSQPGGRERPRGAGQALEDRAGVPESFFLLRRSWEVTKMFCFGGEREERKLMGGDAKVGKVEGGFCIKN